MTTTQRLTIVIRSVTDSVDEIIQYPDPRRLGAPTAPIVSLSDVRERGLEVAIDDICAALGNAAEIVVQRRPSIARYDRPRYGGPESSPGDFTDRRRPC